MIYIVRFCLYDTFRTGESRGKIYYWVHIGLEQLGKEERLLMSMRFLGVVKIHLRQIEKWVIQL